LRDIDYQFIGKPEERANVSFTSTGIDFIESKSAILMLEFEPCVAG
jgi:hypothetical protein